MDRGVWASSRDRLPKQMNYLHYPPLYLIRLPSIRQFRNSLTPNLYTAAQNSASKRSLIGLVGVRQMYDSLGTPKVAVADSVRVMNATTTMLSNEDASEVGTYFDCLINALN